MKCTSKSAGCGGCDTLDIEYKVQLEQKHEQLKKLFGKFGTVEPVIAADEPLHYRCKIINTYAVNKRGEIAAGLYAKKTHKVINTSSCLLEDKLAQKAAQAVLYATQKCRYEPFNEDKGFGLVRHFLIRRALYTNQLMVVVVTAQDILPGSKKFVAFMREKCPEITTVVQNVNAMRTSAVLGEKYKTLFGRGFIEDTLCDCRFVISPSSFYQVNPAQAQKLYETAIELAALKEGETALDAYCGTGTIGIAAAKKSGASVAGVELNKDAVKDAIKNAKLNDAKNVRFYSSDAGKFMQKLAEDHENVDCVFLDPPRDGSSEEFLSALCALKPARIIYISCAPDSLARDLEYILSRDKSYKIEKIVPVDMFPQTSHIETICLLSRTK